MDIIYQSMFYLLDLFKGFTGSYALAIIAVTASIRLALWPLNTAQTRSMKKMQELQPKIKALQERFKDEPQRMQQEMMKFYSENKFNPFAGCLPMLIQLPIFIGLYGTLISPDFIAAVGKEDFFFISNLSNTLFSHAGEPLDGTFDIQEKDQFVTARKITVHFNSGVDNVYKITDPKKALESSPNPFIPGEPITFRLNSRYLSESGFTESFIKDKVESADVMVANESTKELEKLTFKPADFSEKTEITDPGAVNWQLSSAIKTQAGENGVHPGVLYLILLYAILTVLYQKVMSAGQAKQEGPQAAMMKLMPLFFVGFLIFLPIPAGVILYLVVTMLLMFAQTLWVKIQDDKANGSKVPAAEVVDIKPENG